MSMFTRKMRMLTAVVMESDKDNVVKALLEKGVMEFVHIGSLPADKMARLSEHSENHIQHKAFQGIYGTEHMLRRIPHQKPATGFRPHCPDRRTALQHRLRFRAQRALHPARQPVRLLAVHAIM